MATYGGTFDIDRQERYDRTQLAIRLLALIVLAILAGSLGWVHFGLYLALPVLGAILISQKGAKTYHEEAGENVTLWLRYAVAFYAYAWLLTDRLPNEDPRQTLRFDIVPSGEPTPGAVLLPHHHRHPARDRARAPRDRRVRPYGHRSDHDPGGRVLP